MKDVPRVLLVSKPIAPPWNDGSKNLVRDIAANAHGAGAEMTVLGVSGGPSLVSEASNDLGAARVVPVFAKAGRFVPALGEQARALNAMVKHAKKHDLLHFVFAPTSRTAQVMRAARPLLRATGFRGSFVQTVASRPRDFSDAKRVVFGDTVVVLSQWAQHKLADAGVEAVVIPPCARAPDVTPQRTLAVRKKLALVDRPVVVYPGDYEVSRGARVFADAVTRLLGELPYHVFVFACRTKTDAAAKIQEELSRRFDHERVRVVGNVDDMHALLACAESVVFPVDDLYGKVDIPLVLIEALALGVPLIVAAGGPLEEIDSARTVIPGDVESIVLEVIRIAGTAGQEIATHRGEACRAEYAARFCPEVVARQYVKLYARLHEQARR